MSRFAVSDKYAGKKGPCPKCKKVIEIPAVTEQVVIHAPEVSGPKDSKGVSVLKPLARKEFTVGLWTWIAVGVATLTILGIAIGVRFSGSTAPISLLAIGAIALAPPIVMLGYTFLRDDGLEGYRGMEYWIRVSICSAVFAATWLIYVGLAYYFEHKSLAEVTTVEMLIYTASMIAIGLTASLLTFELEAFQAAMHYLVYFVATLVLCLIMKVELAEPLASPAPRQGISQVIPNDAIAINNSMR